MSQNYGNQLNGQCEGCSQCGFNVQAIPLTTEMKHRISTCDNCQVSLCFDCQGAVPPSHGLGDKVHALSASFKRTYVSHGSPDSSLQTDISLKDNAADQNSLDYGDSERLNEQNPGSSYGTMDLSTTRGAQGREKSFGTLGPGTARDAQSRENSFDTKKQRSLGFDQMYRAVQAHSVRTNRDRWNSIRM